MAQPDIHEMRKMLSLSSADQIKIIGQIKPGKLVPLWTRDRDACLEKG